MSQQQLTVTQHRIQDRILHRILTTNTFVAMFSDVSPLCTFCEEHRETLTHLFVDCTKVQCIWKNIEDLIRTRLECSVRITKKIIILGLSETVFCKEINLAIQRIVLLGKYYIYKTKVRGGRINETNMRTYIDFFTKAEFSHVKDGSVEAGADRVRVHKLLCLDSCPMPAGDRPLPAGLFAYADR